MGPSCSSVSKISSTKSVNCVMLYICFYTFYCAVYGGSWVALLKFPTKSSALANTVVPKRYVSCIFWKIQSLTTNNIHESNCAQHIQYILIKYRHYTQTPNTKLSPICSPGPHLFGVGRVAADEFRIAVLQSRSSFRARYVLISFKQNAPNNGDINWRSIELCIHSSVHKFRAALAGCCVRREQSFFFCLVYSTLVALCWFSSAPVFFFFFGANIFRVEVCQRSKRSLLCL